MKERPFLAVVLVVLILAVGVLWMRVESLKTKVQALQGQVPTVISVGEGRQNGPANGNKQYFRLIESAQPDPHQSDVGVPWDVERAMMGDGAGGLRSRPEPPVYQAPESIHIQPNLNFDVVPKEPGTN
jgi:hypothetical protein